MGAWRPLTFARHRINDATGLEDVRQARYAGGLGDTATKAVGEGGLVIAPEKAEIPDRAAVRTGERGADEDNHRSRAAQRRSA